MDLSRARFLAEELTALFSASTTRLAVAGGIRREKPDPHDIEIVCEPKPSPYTIGSNLLEAEINYQLSVGVLERGEPDKAGKRAPCGPRYYRLKYKGEKLDLFAVLPPAQWGVVYTIRTGDAEFSHWLVQQGWPKNIRVVDGHLERNGKVLDTPEERDMFRLLGVEWFEPKDRMNVGRSC